jgi:putative transcriptional regulator
MIKVHLKKLLDEQGWSMRAFAREIDHRPESVRQFYNNESLRIPVKLLDRSCKVLNCELSDIITFEPDEGEPDAK